MFWGKQFGWPGLGACCSLGRGRAGDAFVDERRCLTDKSCSERSKSCYINRMAQTLWSQWSALKTEQLTHYSPPSSTAPEGGATVRSSSQAAAQRSLCETLENTMSTSPVLS